MYKNIAFILVLLCAFCSFFSNHQKTDNAYDGNAITVGTNSEFPPFSFKSNGKLVGFDIDIANEVCRRLHKNVHFKDMPFDALLPDLLFGNIDFIAAGMSYTAERAERVSFTKPYLTDDPLMVLMLTSSAPHRYITIDDLFGKTVVVNEGYTADLYLSGKPGIHLLRLAAPSDAFLALKNGRADAFITAESTVKSFLKTQDPSQFQSDAIDGMTETCAIVVSKKNPQLLIEIQSVLDSMAKDGALDQIKTKWKLK